MNQTTFNKKAGSKVNSWLSSEELVEAQSILNPPLMPPSGEVQETIFFSNRSFSAWLTDKLVQKIQQIPNWQKAEPIILGSIAREEFCPASDVDILCCGEESAVKDFIGTLQQQGIKVRARLPLNPEDWSEGVQLFDVLALLKARPLTAEAAKRMFKQQKMIFSKIKSFKKTWIHELQNERELRHQRYDSVANFLEPNIKYGLGGLRDIEQSLQLLSCFPSDFSNVDHALKVLEYYKAFFVSIRQRLHMMEYKEILVAQAQLDLAKWFGFENAKLFMREVQRGLSRVHFYVEWIFEWAKLSSTKKELYLKKKLKTPKQMLAFLKSDQTVVAQKLIRANIDSVFPDAKSHSNKKDRIQILNAALNPKSSESLLLATFQSRLIDKLIPEIKRLVGYVQHDQYHRYSADIHIQQACRELKRVFSSSEYLGTLGSAVKGLRKVDWDILQWSCLLHDIGKGRGEDHSAWGAKFAADFFENSGVPSEVVQEVIWMVQNHLLLSEAAFRKSIHSVDVLNDLMDKQMTSQRAKRLAVFTAIDIKASNPEAWNDWKAKLLGQVLERLGSNEVQNLILLKNELPKYKNLEGLFKDLMFFDPVVLSMLSPKLLAKDLSSLVKKKSLDVKIVKASKGEFWIRVYSPKNRLGFLNQILSLFFDLGVNTRHAAVATISDFGIYDWFLVKSNKGAEFLTAQLLNNLNQKTKTEINSEQIKNTLVKMNQIEIVEQRKDSWVISFRALDQRGLLLQAVQSISALDLDIESASVHTWGREVEDILVVRRDQRDPSELILKLKDQFFLRPAMPV